MRKQKATKVPKKASKPKLKKGAQRVVSLCYLEPVPGREHTRLVIGFGPLDHPWGTGERGETEVAGYIQFGVVEVEVPPTFTYVSVARRQWVITRGRDKVRKSPKAWHLPESKGEVSDG